jgi:hypothetical protein
MMITVSELEAIIAQTPPGEQVQYEAKPIGSVDHVTRKLTELKLSRSSDLSILSLSGLTGSENAFWWRSRRSATRWNFAQGTRNSLIERPRDYSPLACHRDQANLFARKPRAAAPWRRWCVLAREAVRTPATAENES